MGSTAGAYFGTPGASISLGIGTGYVNPDNTTCVSRFWGLGGKICADGNFEVGEGEVFSISEAVTFVD